MIIVGPGWGLIVFNANIKPISHFVGCDLGKWVWDWVGGVQDSKTNAMVVCMAPQ